MARMTAKEKQALYIQVLGNEAGKQLIADLNLFCFGTETTFKGTSDPLEIARREGRREVFLQIVKMLKMNIYEDFDTIVEDDF